MFGFLKDKLNSWVEKAKDSFKSTEKQEKEINKNYVPKVGYCFPQSLVRYALVEVFADNGLSVLTSVVFPNEKFSSINITSAEKGVLKNFTYTALNSIW